MNFEGSANLEAARDRIARLFKFVRALYEKRTQRRANSATNRGCFNLIEYRTTKRSNSCARLVKRRRVPRQMEMTMEALPSG